MVEHDAWTDAFDLKSKPFTCRYSQPKEYHYSIDSIEFMWRLAKSLRNRSDMHDLRVLDLCAGCGVLGFELDFWMPEKINSVDFVDIQSEYARHFEINRLQCKNPSKPMHFHCLNYNTLIHRADFAAAFDLVVCNPPYFRPDAASLSKSHFRNRCHFLLDGSFSDLCRAILHCLSPRGEAYLLLSDLRTQGVDQFKELLDLLPDTHSARTLADVRGTPVVCIQRS